MRLLHRVKLSRRNSLRLAFSAVCSRYLHGQSGPPAVPEFVHRVPARPPQAPSGSQFVASILHLDRHEREHAILGQLLDGNIPDFLRKLAPVKLSYGLVGRAAIAATIFVMPEYLAIGSDHDFLRIPMNLYTAATVADRFGCVLPTRKMVDAIYDQSTSRLTPQPMPAGPEMTSTEYYRAHNDLIERQARTRGLLAGALAAGQKKDVVITNRLRSHPDRIAIYGWHRASGDPIQPLSTVHGAGYADYSHGIRLVAGVALIGDKQNRVAEILRDPEHSRALSDEGVIRLPEGIIGS